MLPLFLTTAIGNTSMMTCIDIHLLCMRFIGLANNKKRTKEDIDNVKCTPSCTFTIHFTFTTFIVDLKPCSSNSIHPLTHERTIPTGDFFSKMRHIKIYIYIYR